MPSLPSLYAEGTRIVLRPARPGDERALIRLATDPCVRRYIGGVRDPREADTRASQTVIAPRPGQFVIVDRSQEKVIGSGDIDRKREPWLYELSYQLLPAAWGQGFALEAVTLARVWFFENTGETALIATTQVANERSTRLLQRAGAVLIREFEQYGLQQLWYEFRAAPEL
jgi:RimJ/RimL family protein N-acetyltransferase